MNYKRPLEEMAAEMGRGKAIETLIYHSKGLGCYAQKKKKKRTYLRNCSKGMTKKMHFRKTTPTPFNHVEDELEVGNNVCRKTSC